MFSIIWCYNECILWVQLLEPCNLIMNSKNRYFKFELKSTFLFPSQVLPIENQMRRPKDMLGWNGVLSTSMTMVSPDLEKKFNFCGLQNKLSVNGHNLGFNVAPKTSNFPAKPTIMGI